MDENAEDRCLARTDRLPTLDALDDATLLVVAACSMSEGMGASGESLPFHDNQGHLPVRATSLRIICKSAGNGLSTVLSCVDVFAVAVSLDSTLLLEDVQLFSFAVAAAAGFFSDDTSSDLVNTTDAAVALLEGDVGAGATAAADIIAMTTCFSSTQ